MGLKNSNDGDNVVGSLGGLDSKCDTFCFMGLKKAIEEHHVVGFLEDLD
jgi:hypothetical protein